MTIRTVIFEGKKPGPVFLALGAIHGNEVCGTIALSRLITEIETGIVDIEKGRLVIAPICNKKAYAANRRFIDANLNRIIARHQAPQTEEHGYANEVIDLIDGSDIVLDLHSYTSGTKPFLFLDDETAEGKAYAAASGIADWVCGWKDVYAGQTDLSDGDTMSYSIAAGKRALLIECGHHEDPASALVGYNALRASLGYFGITSPVSIAAAKPSVHRMVKILTKDKPGAFTRDWKHLTSFTADEDIITYEDGTTFKAGFDGVTLLPKADAAMHGEWLYIGRPAF